MATRGNDWRQTGVMSTQTSLFAAENHDCTSDVIHRCMLGKASYRAAEAAPRSPRGGHLPRSFLPLLLSLRL